MPAETGIYAAIAALVGEIPSGWVVARTAMAGTVPTLAGGAVYSDATDDPLDKQPRIYVSVTGHSIEERLNWVQDHKVTLRVECRYQYHDGDEAVQATHRLGQAAKYAVEWAFDTLAFANAAWGLWIRSITYERLDERYLYAAVLAVDLCVRTRRYS